MKRFIAAFVFVVLLGASPCSAQTTAQAALPGLHKSALDRNDAVPNTATAASATATGLPGAPLARDPIFVYNNWSAYDELSDNIPLTEQLAMKDLDEILRLRRFGIRFDYYTMDAFWFDPDGGYRAWRKPSWPNGPDEWIRKCRKNGILPGLWFSTNTLVKINAIPQWQNSLNEKKGAMSFFEGGFLPNFVETLQYWYDRGIRLYKFDFVDFGAATPATVKTKTAEEIRARNADAFRDALKQFRRRNPEVVLVAFNGFGGDVESTAGPFPFRNAVDLRWLEVFDSLYSGDPRPSDVPEMNFWRSMDIYSDHMVRRYEQSFLPLERIDSTGFMLGNTGTIYYRKTHAWKGALILMMARGGWVNTVYGSLELLSDDDARWFRKVQALYLPLESKGRTKSFGGIPGDVEPYGFGSVVGEGSGEGSVYAVVNPAQSVEEVELPRLSREQAAVSGGRVLFRDAGFQPVLASDRIRLGPGQMAVVGFGKYSNKSGSVWTGQLWPKGSGTVSQPIMIDKYGGEAKPVINGNGEAEDAVLLKNQEYREIRNLDVTNTGTSPGVRRGVRTMAVDYGDVHHIYVQDLDVHDVNGSNGMKENGGITYYSAGDAKPSRFVDLRIEGNRIHHVDRSGIFGWSTRWVRSKWYPSLGVVIRKNVVDDVGGDGIVAVATDGALVEYNVVSSASQRSQDYNVGIWPWSADNTVVQFNEVYGTRGQHDAEGFDSDWNSRNTVIQYNYSHDNEGGFLLICSEGSQSPQNSAGNSGTIVRYNISQNDHHRGIKLSGPVKNTLIYNNTIYVAKGENVDVVLHTDWTGWATDTYFYNNIFYVEGTARFSYGVSGNPDGSYVTAPGPGKSTNNVYDYNVYYGVPTADDPHALTSNPLMVDSGHAAVGRHSVSGYALRKNSPAIDSGKRIENNGGRDFLGVTVPQCGGIDRGAMEATACGTR